LIFISHDVHFIRAIGTSVLHITAGANHAGGKPTLYPGDYDYYLDKSKTTSARTALTAGSAPNNRKRITDNAARTAGGSRKQKRLEADSRNAIAKARREKEKRVHELETKITALEGQQKELAAALEDPATY